MYKNSVKVLKNIRKPSDWTTRLKTKSQPTGRLRELSMWLCCAHLSTRKHTYTSTYAFTWTLSRSSNCHQFTGKYSQLDWLLCAARLRHYPFWGQPTGLQGRDCCWLATFILDIYVYMFFGRCTCSVGSV